MSDRILAPLDGSETSEEALPYVASLAWRLGAEVVLLRVIPEYPVVLADSMYVGLDLSSTIDVEAPEAEEKEAGAYLRRIANDLEGDNLSVTWRVMRGRVPEMLIQAASEYDVRFVAMTTHSRAGLSRLVLGSVAAQVVKDGGRPVLLVHSHKIEAYEPRLSDWMMHEPLVSKVLVPLDGSKVAECILPVVADLATRLGGEVVLLAVSPHTDYSWPQGSGRGAGEEVQLPAYLGMVKTWLTEKGLKVAAKVVHGDPVRTIIQVTQSEGCDLIAMSTHGRTGITRLLMGSVSEGVLRAAPVPVLMCAANAVHS